MALQATLRVRSETDILVLPTTYAEGTPKSMLEAIAWRDIATDSNGCRDVCVNGGGGFLLSDASGSELIRILDALQQLTLQSCGSGVR